MSCAQGFNKSAKHKRNIDMLQCCSISVAVLEGLDSLWRHPGRSSALLVAIFDNDRFGQPR